MEPQPQWERIDTTRRGKLLSEGRQFALYMHGPGPWTKAHQAALDSYIKKNS